MELLGPDMIPHSRRVVRGREEFTTTYREANLVISFQVLGYPECTIALVDARGLDEDERQTGYSSR